MSIEYGLLFCISFIAAALSTPLLRRIAVWLDVTDQPSGRKVHTEPVPYLGGLAFHFSMACVLIALWVGMPHILDDRVFSLKLLILFGIAGGFQLLGVIDDVIHVSPLKKLMVEIMLSVVLVRSGFSISQMTSPLGGTIQVDWFGDVLSVLWIVTIVNAINFIDGLDGLAGGVVFFAALANFLIALSPWQHFICVISLVLMGATLGFLPYNFAKKKIFMGDAGSLYLGVLLAGSSLASNVKGATVMSLALPLVILAIPLIDTLLTVVRRGRAGVHLFKADKEHLHHRLLRLGFSDRQAVLFLYGLCFLFAMSAVLAAQLPDQYTYLFIFVFMAAVLWGLLVFSAFERRLIQNSASPSHIADPKQTRK